MSTQQEADVIPIPRKDIQALRMEVTTMQEKLNQFRTLCYGLKVMLKEIKDVSDGSIRDITPDSGMGSGNANKTKYKPQNDDKVDKTPSEIPVANEILVKNEELRPEVPLLYGMLRHNPKKNAVSDQKTEEVSVAPPSNNNTTPSTSEYLHKKKRACKDFQSTSVVTSTQSANTGMIRIGTGMTVVPRSVYNKINWNSYTIATRRLLMAVFSRRILATHSLTGKASPAFANKPAKLCLDPKKVSDIIITVTEKCKVKENLVRNAITTKCADENKMMRIQEAKKNATC